MSARRSLATAPRLALLTTSGGAVGGMETFVRSLIPWLVQDGWRLTVGVNGFDFLNCDSRMSNCASWAGTPRASEGSTTSAGEDSQLQTAIRSPHCVIESLSWVNAADLSGDRRYTLAAVMDRYRWFRRIRPDVAMFVQSSNTPFRASVLGARLAGVPVVTTQRTMPAVIPAVPSRRHCFGLFPGLGLHRWRLILSSRLTAMLADQVVYNSEAVRALYEFEYGYPISKGRIIANAVAQQEGPSRHPRDPLRPVTLGFAGRLGREKRIDVLFQAAARLPSNAAWRIELHGEGPERDRLIDLARELGLGPRVQFCGTSAQVDLIYRGLDVVVLCSPRESSSNMVLEAMAAGCAVVVTKTGGLPEMVEQGRAGVIVTPLDIEQLASVLKRLIEDPHERTRLGRSARERALSHHDPVDIAQQWTSVLRDVARIRESSPGVLNRKSAIGNPQCCAEVCS